MFPNTYRGCFPSHTRDVSQHIPGMSPNTYQGCFPTHNSGSIPTSPTGKIHTQILEISDTHIWKYPNTHSGIPLSYLGNIPPYTHPGNIQYTLRGKYPRLNSGSIPTSQRGKSIHTSWKYPLHTFGNILTLIREYPYHTWEISYQI